MPAPSAFAGSQVLAVGCGLVLPISNGAPTTYAMASLNTGWCARFTAKDTRDILTVYVNWSVVTSAGVVECRIETIDATTGKPSGSLYDANATKSQAPVAGWQAFTFASPPTTGLTAGTEYAIILLTTTGGTAHTLRSHEVSGPGATYPTIVLTAADGTTRSNFAEVTAAVPNCTVVYEDSQEETLSITACGNGAAGTALDIYGVKAAGLKFVVPANESWIVDGVTTLGLARTGSPNDLRVRIFNSSDSAVSGTTRTVDKDSLTNVAVARRVEICFAAPVTLTAGTYRIVFDDAAGTGTNTNKYTLAVTTLRSSTLCPPSISSTSTADITAGTITWVDDQTVINGSGLSFGGDSASAGGASPRFGLAGGGPSFAGRP